MGGKGNEMKPKLKGKFTAGLFNRAQAQFQKTYESKRKVQMSDPVTGTTKSNLGRSGTTGQHGIQGGMRFSKLPKFSHNKFMEKLKQAPKETGRTNGTNDEDDDSDF